MELLCNLLLCNPGLDVQAWCTRNPPTSTCKKWAKDTLSVRCNTDVLQRRAKIWHYQWWDMKLHIHFNTTEGIFRGGCFFGSDLSIPLSWQSPQCRWSQPSRTKQTDSRELIWEGSQNQNGDLTPPTFGILSFCQTSDFADNCHSSACTTSCNVLDRYFFPRPWQVFLSQQVPHPVAWLTFLKQNQPFPRSPGCSFHCPSAGHSGCGAFACTLCPCFQGLCCYPYP